MQMDEPLALLGVLVPNGHMVSRNLLKASVVRLHKSAPNATVAWCVTLSAFCEERHIEKSKHLLSYGSPRRTVILVRPSCREEAERS
jgi:hypothetical protein